MQPPCSMDSTGMGYFSCNFSFRRGRIGAQHCWRWEAGLAPSELPVSSCGIKSLQLILLDFGFCWYKEDQNLA